jgi:hypothetical protein
LFSNPEFLYGESKAIEKSLSSMVIHGSISLSDSKPVQPLKEEFTSSQTLGNAEKITDSIVEIDQEPVIIFKKNTIVVEKEKITVQAMENAPVETMEKMSIEPLKMEPEETIMRNQEQSKKEDNHGMKGNGAGFLDDIRNLQFNLKKVHRDSHAKRPVRNADQDIANILMRRVALEMSDSDDSNAESDGSWK